MEFWALVVAISIVSVIIVSRMDVVTDEELNQDPWQNESI